MVEWFAAGETQVANALSAFHLEKAKQNAANARLAIELVQADMRGFVRPEGFDLALSRGAERW